MKMRLVSFIFVFVFLNISTHGFSQDTTIGTLLNTSDAFSGYTLIASSLSRITYLVDNCGREINRWESDYRPGAVAYLLENGNLLRAGSVQGFFNGGGRGGIIELFDWDGNLIWQYRMADEQHHLHHDLEILPNGNILAVAWEKKTAEEAIEKGVIRQIGNNGIWPDKVVELKPIGFDDVEIVWEWHVWDHMVQDNDTTLSTYGEIAQHPELINMNLSFGNNSDWNHCNAIDYNPQLDQIMINSRNFDEFWVIDHSTTTQEAASHEGGRYGKGGDILYRWGNPLTYERGNESDKVFSGQHDAHWIQEGDDKGKIMVFNNATNRTYSSVDVLDPAIDENGFYTIDSDLKYGPDHLFWSYSFQTGGIFFSAGRVSGASRLPNGNTMITNGQTGYIWEVDPSNTIVWEYQNPVASQPLTQGTNGTGNSIFRAYKYSKYYGAFEGREILPMEPLELNPTNDACIDFLSNVNETNDLSFTLSPNPVSDFLFINGEIVENQKVTIVNINGQIIRNINLFGKENSIDLSDLHAGFYFVNISTKSNQTKTYKVIKL